MQRFSADATMFPILFFFPKLPRISFPFYKFFCPIVSAKVSAHTQEVYIITKEIKPKQLALKKAYFDPIKYTLRLKFVFFSLLCFALFSANTD